MCLLFDMDHFQWYKRLGWIWCKVYQFNLMYERLLKNAGLPKWNEQVIRHWDIIPSNLLVETEKCKCNYIGNYQDIMEKMSTLCSNDRDVGPWIDVTKTPFKHQSLLFIMSYLYWQRKGFKKLSNQRWRYFSFSWYMIEMTGDVSDCKNLHVIIIKRK